MRIGTCEVFESEYIECTECQAATLDIDHAVKCDHCGNKEFTVPLTGWFYWCCMPGCLPEGDAMGPFDSADHAIADADANDYIETEDMG